MLYNQIYNRFSELTILICKEKAALLSILEKTETRKTAISEIEKVLCCLDNIHEQIHYLSKPKLDSLCVFLPLNQPLYSLFLFAIIPGCRFHKVYFRPPKLLSQIYDELYSILNLSKYGICCEIVSRRAFITHRVSYADCVIYTGKYENALEVKRSLPNNSIFIFQGSGTNPIVVSENTYINNDIIEKIVNAQIYNSGQDCMAPAAIFVHKNSRECFLAILKKRIKNLIIGNYTDENVDISKLIEYETLNNVKKLLSSSFINILYGGSIDFSNQIVYPSIIEYSDINNIPAESSFSPVFSLYFYETEDEIIKYLSRSDCQKNKAYISIFGKLTSWHGDEILIQDDILDSIDDGNSEFGGFGIHSGFISFNELITSKPILISKELSMFSRINDSVTPEGSIDYPLFETFITDSLVNLFDKNVLEIGCGLLPHAQLLINHCNNYNAIDINSDLISFINLDAISHKIKFSCMDACKTIFPNDYFSVAILFHCFHEVELINQGRILKEILRILSNSGYLLFIDTISDRTTSFQKCFDIVHEEFLDYKHIYGVMHSQWILSEYVKRGILREIHNQSYKMNYHFDTLYSLCSAIKNSFSFEISWDDKKDNMLLDLLKHICGERNEYNFEEEIRVRLLQKHEQ